MFEIEFTLFVEFSFVHMYYFLIYMILLNTVVFSF